LEFNVKILGSNSATPVYNRHPSAQLLNINQNLMLLDCGEGTQMQLINYKIRYQKINHIFITHLHGDHYFGLIGLLSTMHLHGRKNDIDLFGPAGLDEIITLQLKYSETFLNYKINFHLVDTEKVQQILDSKHFVVETIPLNHRIKCCGYLFKEKPKKKRIIKEKLPENLSLANLALLKDGKDVTDDNGSILIKNEDVTLPPRKSRTYAYCTDTAYMESIIPQIANADLLYHESTFLSDMKARAIETHHTTCADAATLAKKADVNKLVIGHFSSRYKDLTPFLKEARTIFPNTSLAIEGELFEIPEE